MEFEQKFSQIISIIHIHPLLSVDQIRAFEDALGGLLTAPMDTSARADYETSARGDLRPNFGHLSRLRRALLYISSSSALDRLLTATMDTSPRADFDTSSKAQLDNWMSARAYWSLLNRSSRSDDQKKSIIRLMRTIPENIKKRSFTRVTRLIPPDIQKKSFVRVMRLIPPDIQKKSFVRVMRSILLDTEQEAPAKRFPRFMRFKSVYLKMIPMKFLLAFRKLTNNE